MKACSVYHLVPVVSCHVIRKIHINYFTRPEFADEEVIIIGLKHKKSICDN